MSDPATSPADLDAHRLSLGVSRGQPAALEALYRDWFPWMLAAARRLGSLDESSALDVVQDATIRLARSMPALRTHAELERWMIRLMHTTTLDLLRRRARRWRRERDPRPAPRKPIDDRIDRLALALAALPPEDRSLLGLRFALGRSLDASGAALGTTGDAAHGRLRRILHRLRPAAQEPDHDR
ncbi:MAG: RNA polymerase sigma factor [Phycisphaerales bacterium]